MIVYALLHFSWSYLTSKVIKALTIYVMYDAPIIVFAVH